MPKVRDFRTRPMSRPNYEYIGYVATSKDRPPTIQICVEDDEQIAIEKVVAHLESEFGEIFVQGGQIVYPGHNYYVAGRVTGRLKR